MPQEGVREIGEGTRMAGSVRSDELDPGKQFNGPPYGGQDMQRSLVIRADE